MDISHKTHVAKLSNLGRTANFAQMDEGNEEEEDPEEVAFRERLRKLAEEEETTSQSDPFGLGDQHPTSRPFTNSLFGDDKLSSDAQKAMDMLRRTSMAINDDDGYRIGSYNEEDENETNEASFKAQQARLKALAAAAQPGAVRSNLARNGIPKPPGLVDADYQRRMKEREKRLSVAETAAIMAGTGINANDSHEVKAHIDQVVKENMAVVERSQPTEKAGVRPKTAVPPPASVLGPPPGLDRVLPAPPALRTPDSSVSSFTNENTKPNGTSAKNVALSTSSAVSSQSPSKTDINRKKSTAEPTVVIYRSTTSSFSSPSQDDSQVKIYKSLSLSKRFLDIMCWKTPILAAGCVLFGTVYVATALSRNWSTITVWAVFAIFRVFFLRMNGMFANRMPESLKKILVVNDTNRLPGSLTFTADALKYCYILSIVMQEEFLAKGIHSWAGFLLVMSLIGIKLNIGVAVIIVLFLSSVGMAIYKAVPQAFATHLAKLPVLKDLLSRI